MTKHLIIKKSEPADNLFRVLCGIISLLIFIVDLYTPQSIAGGVPYITVVLISLWSPRRHFTVFVAVCCSLLTIIGLVCSLDVSPLAQELSNRILALLTIWATTFLTLLRKNTEQSRERAVAEKERALEQVKVLRGFLPICSGCKKIRDDEGYWNQIEDYIISHSEADFSHGICPACSKTMYPELYE